MTAARTNVRWLLLAAGMLCILPAPALAQRTLHWDRIEVEAHLEASGTLRVAETQTFVFTGDWNGGERRFDVRPRQTLNFLGLSREIGGEWRALTLDPDLDDVDDYGWADAERVRWRSRMPSDPPFANTAIRYRLEYELSNILLNDGTDFVLDHDFLFQEREGNVDHFTLRLTLDPAWQPRESLRESYTGEGIGPDRGFVLTVPMAFSGSGVPATLDTSRPPAFAAAVAALAGVTGLAVLWLFVREESNGRFAPLPSAVDESWLRANVLNYPAEVVGALWDEGIGSPEVVALIARMVGDGTLGSDVSSKGVMSLQLKVDRETLQGHERALVDKLFFNGRTTTSTTLVRQHYRTKGFNPAEVIRPELEQAVTALLPPGRQPQSWWPVPTTALVMGTGLFVRDWSRGGVDTLTVALVVGGTLLLMLVGLAIGMQFRANMQWGRARALACLTPAIATAAGLIVYLWFYAGVGVFEVSSEIAVALGALGVAVILTLTNAMKSRHHRAALAVRKQLTAGRQYFVEQLGTAQPALRDEWMPWLLAFGLKKAIDRWSTSRPSEDGRRSSRRSGSIGSTSSSSGSGTSSSEWTGFSGGRSGGAGGGASWAAAASSMAATVSPPSSSGSSSGGGSSSSSSSSGGSSGGGGGGGW